MNSFALKQADHCEMLRGDGEILEINEEHTPNMKWAEVADKNITMKMEFWWNVVKSGGCKVAETKALVRRLKCSLRLKYFTINNKKCANVKFFKFFFRKISALNSCVQMNAKRLKNGLKKPVSTAKKSKLPLM